MKVKIGDEYFDSMVILDDKDKENIAKMPPEAHRYCSFPDNGDYEVDEIKRWMIDEEEL